MQGVKKQLKPEKATKPGLSITTTSDLAAQKEFIEKEL